MNGSLRRRITVANCWASIRISVLDRTERYEDSYAITQEFREWITALGENPEFLENTLLKVPNFVKDSTLEETSDSDEKLEI